jgi:hypothetical protein
MMTSRNRLAPFATCEACLADTVEFNRLVDGDVAVLSCWLCGYEVRLEARSATPGAERRFAAVAAVLGARA